MEKIMLPIEVSALLAYPNMSKYHVVKCTFYALREHRELLNSPDYKRLYDEAIDYSYRCSLEYGIFTDITREEAYSILEFTADLQNDNAHIHKFHQFTVEDVDHFLEQRKQAWSGEISMLLVNAKKS